MGTFKIQASKWAELACWIKLTFGENEKSGIIHHCTLQFEFLTLILLTRWKWMNEPNIQQKALKKWKYNIYAEAIRFETFLLHTEFLMWAALHANIKPCKVLWYWKTNSIGTVSKVDTVNTLMKQSINAFSIGRSTMLSGLTPS